jgi:diketogulonate reductase-like aldo/keto reductase
MHAQHDPNPAKKQKGPLMKIVEANGARIPAIGFGTWTLRGTQARDLVASAIQAGYRHIDTAAMYENEEAVGEGLRASGIDRGEVFLTTKIWPDNLAAGDLQRAVEDSLSRLGVEQVDLALIHWPSKTIPLAESIEALNEVRERGLARHIGVSNFTTRLLAEAVALSSAPLVCNQIECHPFLNQDKVIAVCAEHGMAVVSYCPLARGAELFAHEAVAACAERHGKTPAQVILRWHVQQGLIAIPRSSNPDRARENLDIFDFELGPQEMAAISGLRSRSLRICDFDFSPEWDAA